MKSIHIIRAKELKEEQKLIEPQIKSLHKQISDIDCKIDEINSVIRVYNSDETTNEVEISEAISDVINEEDSDAFKRVILQTVESERQRIARDLHDSTVQRLTLWMLTLSGAGLSSRLRERY